jgi:hypothetical protein
MKIDNFALMLFQECPAKYFLRIQEKWESRYKGGALGFGAVIHKGLEVWYRDHDLISALNAMEECWPADHPPDDFRTLARAREMLIRYVREYPAESFKVLSTEISFSLPLGMQTDCGEDIEYGGIPDLLVAFNKTVYVVDHKTTSMLGPTYFLQYNPNNQISGYIWGAQELSRQKVNGAIINALCMTKSGKMDFARSITTRTESDIEAWKRDVQKTCSLIKNSSVKGFGPSSLIHAWGSMEPAPSTASTISPSPASSKLGSKTTT